MDEQISKTTVKNIDKSSIEGLPEGAFLQRNGAHLYVYFKFSFMEKVAEEGEEKGSEEGAGEPGEKPRVKTVEKTERDYIGKVIDGKFVPNAYYLREKPVAGQRPDWRWKSMAQRVKSLRERNGLPPEE
ncbi:hypothetical protein [Sutterella sp.]|uniref:hypothetical protein n=1 Tax=Sutterella sp. TaxID=1981025 RepID=UPI0026E081B5|nr:hypothetical protein [Sutterella sp.]MDO5532857.1 hypothetical protein [Sutterella sp.]